MVFFGSSRHFPIAGQSAYTAWQTARCRNPVVGGSGGLAIGLAEALPHLQVTVAELPLVAKFTRRFVERAGAAGRVQVQAVDIVHQPITGTFDGAILKYILNVMSPEEAGQVLLNVHRAQTRRYNLHTDCSARRFPADTTGSSLVGPDLHNDIRSRPESHGARVSRPSEKAGFEDFELHDDRIITAQKPVRAHSIDTHRR